MKLFIVLHLVCDYSCSSCRNMNEFCCGDLLRTLLKLFYKLWCLSFIYILQNLKNSEFQGTSSPNAYCAKHFIWSNWLSWGVNSWLGGAGEGERSGKKMLWGSSTSAEPEAEGRWPMGTRQGRAASRSQGEGGGAVVAWVRSWRKGSEEALWNCNASVRLGKRGPGRTPG